mmetsp:Transcript_10207/g.16592  ORF Transcript_10207/g.16592 Transcript_10207/m.16592 type:complete len:129 (+) Transcript_10207:1124-1510(+)
MDFAIATLLRGRAQERRSCSTSRTLQQRKLAQTETEGEAPHPHRAALGQCIEGVGRKTKRVGQGHKTPVTTAGADCKKIVQKAALYLASSPNVRCAQEGEAPLGVLVLLAHPRLALRAASHAQRAIAA